MLSQSSSVCLSDAIELINELSISLRRRDTTSLPRQSRDKTGQSSPDSWEVNLGSQEVESFYNSLTHIKSLLLEERDRQQKSESQNIKINQQLASALSTTSLHAESLKKQLQQAKSSSNKDEVITDYNSSGSERENMNREIKLLTESKTRLQEGIAELERRMGTISEAGRRYEGLRQVDLQMNLGVSDLEINRLREEVNIHIADKKKLRNDKQDLVSTLKQLYSALDEKEGETSTMIKSYDRRLAEKDELLTVTLKDKMELEVELTVKSKEHKEYSRSLKLELEQLQKKLQEYESTSDADRVMRRTRSPTDSSWGNRSQPSQGESHSSHNIQHDSIAGSEEASSSDRSKPNKATGVAEVSKRANNNSNNVYMNGKAVMETQYATVGPPHRQKDKKQKHHSYTESSLTKSLDRDLNSQSGVSLFKSQFSSFRMSERKTVPNHLKSSQSVEHMSPLLPYKQQGVQGDNKVTRTRSRSMNANEVENDKESPIAANNNNGNGNIFSHSLSRIFTRNKRKKQTQNRNIDRTSSFVQPPTYSNLPPQTSNSAKHKLLDNSKSTRTPQREAPPPPPPVPKHLSSVSLTVPVSPELQRSYFSLTKSIFGSEERKIGLLEETRKVHISRWNHITVLAWMDVRLGMTKYLQSALNVIQSGQTLLELTDSDLEIKLGIVNPVHKRKLMLAIEDCRRPQNNPHPNIKEMDHYWVAQIWLPRLGLSNYSKLFYSNLVDGRVLRSLGKREADELLKIAPRIDQMSLMSGIKLLKHFDFNKDLWLEGLNTEPVFWDNERIFTWLQSVNLMEYADQVLSSGVHGALVCMEPNFTYETLAYIMNIPQNDTEHRRSLRRHLESLTNTFNGFSSQPSQDNSLTRSSSVPRSYTTPHHGYVADKQQSTNSYNRGFTQDSATSLSRNLSLSFHSSRQSVTGRRVESTPV